MTPNQIEKAKVFYNDHKSHIDKLIKNATLSYPPTLAADKNDPRLWTANHWRWFKQLKLYSKQTKL